LILITALLIGSAVPTIAHAAPGDGVDFGGGNDDGTIAAGAAYTREGVRSGRSNCTWTLATGGLIVVGNGTTSWPRVVGTQTYNLYVRTCPDGVTFVEVAEATPADLLPALLNDLRSRLLPRPTPVFEALDPEFGWAYVRTPLDFRAGGNSWRELSVTASAGPVWATVTATPSVLTFDPGDPLGDGPVSCSGPAAIAPYVPERPGECSYTFTNSSSTSDFDGYHFLTTMSIRWTLTWTSSGGGAGSFDPYTTSATAELAVAEVKGLVTCTGPRSSQGGC
jgi:hypothetical protein